MKCEKCGKEHDGSYGSGRFCSQTCARSFSTCKSRTEINKKISSTIVDNSELNYYNNPKYCKICNSIIPYKYRKRNTCSDTCKSQLKLQQFSHYSTLGGLASAKS